MGLEDYHQRYDAYHYCYGWATTPPANEPTINTIAGSIRQNNRWNLRTSEPKPNRNGNKRGEIVRHGAQQRGALQVSQTREKNHTNRRTKPGNTPNERRTPRNQESTHRRGPKPPNTQRYATAYHTNKYTSQAEQQPAVTHEYPERYEHNNQEWDRRDHYNAQEPSIISTVYKYIEERKYAASRNNDRNQAYSDEQNKLESTEMASELRQIIQERYPTEKIREFIVHFYKQQGIEAIFQPPPDDTRTARQTTHQQDSPEEVLTAPQPTPIPQAPTASTNTSPTTEPGPLVDTTEPTVSTVSADSSEAITTPRAASPLPSGTPVAEPGPLVEPTHHTDESVGADRPEAITMPRAALSQQSTTPAVEPSPLDETVHHTNTSTEPESIPGPPITPLESSQEPPSDDAASPTSETSGPMGAEVSTKDPVHPHAAQAPGASPPAVKEPRPTRANKPHASPGHTPAIERSPPDEPAIERRSPDVPASSSTTKSGRTTSRPAKPRPTTARASPAEPQPTRPIELPDSGTRAERPARTTPPRATSLAQSTTPATEPGPLGETTTATDISRTPTKPRATLAHLQTNNRNSAPRTHFPFNPGILLRATRDDTLPAPQTSARTEPPRPRSRTPPSQAPTNISEVSDL